ncbi:DNA-binding protein [Longimycelium tulufanense]|uniref:DNA-binding protein n=1 Tax=Longimycelium tulufanense TaxID=907463 RepID=A0A8J3CDF3_9PSEU|nr:helix-turn-helix transcriptional regulator [Longimycelium tulufanense]GGM57878.1 DNA-binding protein [Longimycelium tulufanense]
MDRREELREFLKSRRARVRPDDVGLAQHGGRRRVPGLRREEVARLAGVSVDYYVRLEQGRGQNPSAEVLDSIARTLRLDASERTYLFELVRPVPGIEGPAAPQTVRPGVRRLLDSLAHSPAYVLGRRLEVLAWNTMARVLIADFPALPAGGRNLARLVFLDSSARQRYVNWQRKADDTVAILRMDFGRHPRDPRLNALVAELSAESADFRRMWSDRHVQEKTHGDKSLYHPLVGTLPLSFETLRLPDDPDQALVVYVADPGSRAEQELRLLASKAESGKLWAAP